MGRFDGLAVLTRPFDCDAGCSELCTGAGGVRTVRLRLRREACQREVLSAGWPGVPLRVEENVLELLPPYREGQSLASWLETAPSLAQRREACLSLLAQCILDAVPACVLVPAARTENLLFTGSGAGLQYLPDWAAWKPGFSAAHAANALACLCCEILTRGLTPVEERCLPGTLRLLCMRAGQEDYRGLEQLQQELAGLPDSFPPPFAALRARLGWLRGRVLRLAHPGIRVLAAVLVVLALLSLAAAYRIRQDGRRNLWPGISPVGNQEMDR